MASVYEIIQGISQVMAKTYDGALDEDGNPVKIGLRREEPVSIYDKRLMDGFSVKMEGNLLKLCYSSETTLKEVYSSDFENEITQVMEQCISFLKKEYKKITKNSLGLKAVGEPKLLVQHMNRVRTWVEAHQLYEISGIDSPEKSTKTSKEKLSDAVKSWMGLK